MLTLPDKLQWVSLLTTSPESVNRNALHLRLEFLEMGSVTHKGRNTGNMSC